MPPPRPFPQFPSSTRHGPHSLHPINPHMHSPQNASDPEPGRDTRVGRPTGLTNDSKKRSRNNSTPPESRYPHSHNSPQHLPVSADGSRAFAQGLVHGWTPRNAQVDFQVQGMAQVNGQPVTQFPADPHSRPRRNSDAHPPTHPPAPRPRRMSVSTPVDSPVIPGITTNDVRVPTRLRKNSHRRHRILFYHRHEPHYGFTNFSAHSVVYEGKEYPTSEHLFQSFKFIHRPGLAEHIRTCSPRPSVAFSEARRFAQEVRPDWSHENINAMNIVLYHKFTQNKDLKRELLSTGDAELIENSDKDAFWGCGADGKGKNELGKALERLRAQLRSEAARR